MDHSRTHAVAVIGAGPYGLSIAAHLRAHGVDFRIFGTPMHSWQAHMPAGMFLKSEGCASSLSEPTGYYTLKQYCADEGLTYGEHGIPVPGAVFTQYGLSFQKRLVPTVEDTMVTALDKMSDSFELRLASGEKVRTKMVVVATGLSNTAHIPRALAHLPPELLSHSSSHHDLGRFKGRDVTVIGGGQSALEAAALLHEVGADVRVLVRRPELSWNSTPIPGRRSLYDRTRRPMSNLGIGRGAWLYCNAPNVLCHLPERVRLAARVRQAFGPAGAWWLKERVLDRLPIMLGQFVQAAEARDGRVLLQLQGWNSERCHLMTDHVIAATGYRFALTSLPFLGERLLPQLRSVRQTPILSSNFESCVPGLYFTGLASAIQFGPAMRFLHGADYTARRISHHILGDRTRFRAPLSDGFKRLPRCKEFVTGEVVRPVIADYADANAHEPGQSAPVRVVLVQPSSDDLILSNG